jgi:hypothetical protein
MVTVGTVTVLGVEFEVILVPRGNRLPRKALRTITTEGVELPSEPPPAAPALRLVPRRAA